MSEGRNHISVCICTYERGTLLGRLLGCLGELETGGQFTYSVVVADNSPEQTARAVVDGFRNRPGGPGIVYCAEPERNIALVRNAALRHAHGEFAAFIDDDEFPVSDWLLRALAVLRGHDAGGVLGPVLPHFDEAAPEWVKKGGFFDRPRHPSGFVLPWSECRTGNVLFRTSILDDIEGPFSAEFATGGEDQDFFRRLIGAGHRFVWCDEAITYEEVPASRCCRRFLMGRALLRGQNTIKHRQNRAKLLLKSLVAVPAYGLALLPLAVAGQHLFMRYLIKLGDHTGRILAWLGIHVIKERQM